MDLNSFPTNKEANRSRFKQSQQKKIHHTKNKKGQKASTSRDPKNNKICEKLSDNSDSDDEFFTNTLLSQPNSRFADIDDHTEDRSGKAFEELLNVPVSTSSFQFKHEKNWTWDTSKYSDYFSVDVDNLSKIFNCIPFNQYIEVDEKYFNRDELTYIYSSAEQARKDYMKELAEFEKTRIVEKKIAGENNTIKRDDVTRDNIDSADDIEDDLDFLLTLKEPVRTLPVNASSTTSRVKDFKEKSISKPTTKSIDLEKWLDSVLDD